MFFCHKNYYAPCHSQHKKKSVQTFLFLYPLKPYKKQTKKQSHEYVNTEIVSQSLSTCQKEEQ